MFQPSEIKFIQNAVEEAIRRHYAGQVTVEEGPGLAIEGDRERAHITAESKSALARGFFRLMQELAGGRGTVSVREEKHFPSCGSFLDFSRNGVMTVEAVKRYITMSAALGLDTIVLYTEDTYTVPEYPYMGYLRGRLTPEEIRQMDDYAFALGLELVPCIQTLAHMGNFLQWKADEHLKDQPTILLCDEEETYSFIEAEIRAMRGCVRSKRIHIGMDEANSVGLGQYYKKFGYTDRFQLLTRHLNRIVPLCEKYGFHAMMWSDMFFRLGSKTYEYCDPESHVPQSVIDQLPDVDMCYWDYDTTEDPVYEHMLAEHERMSPSTVFAGGIWTWSGFLPHVQRTGDTMEAAMRACLRHKLTAVLGTTWGDDGNECNPFLALNQMTIFSEYCWRGEACTHEIITQTGEFLTSLPDRAYQAFDLFYPCVTDRRTGKALIWCDLLYPLGPRQDELPGALERSRKALSILADYPDNPDCVYARALFDVCARKADLKMRIRPAYLAGDRKALEEIARWEIPALIDAYDHLRRLHKAQWETTYKRNGWEVLALRYGSVMGRLADVQDSILRWCAGELPNLCELDEEPMDPTRKGGMQFYQCFVSPVFNL